MTSVLGWTVRELRVRWRNALFAASLVAALSGAAATLELLGRGRDEAVVERFDAIGAPLTLAPSGTSAGALERGDTPGVPLGPGLEREVGAALGHDLRRLERRLVGRVTAPNGTIHLLGTDTASAPDPGERPVAAPGSELALRLHGAGELDVQGKTLKLSNSLPSSGSADDLALVTTLELAENLTGIPGYNELRVYLAPGVSQDAGYVRLKALPGVSVLRRDRGVVADGDAEASLALHRRVVYLVMAVVMLVGLGVAAHLAAAERRGEMATLLAIGAPRQILVITLLGRSVIVSLIGCIAGLILGAVVALENGASGTLVLRSSGSLATLLACAVLVGIAAALPSALMAADRDPVPDLQDLA